MEAEVFTDGTLKFIVQAFSSYAESEEGIKIIERVKQTSKGTVRIETTDGRNFLIVMIEDKRVNA